MGLFSSVGGFINDLTGASSSAAKQNKYQLGLNALSYQQQKEFAQNAHQWEADDLEKAGFNRALTATGSSAGAIAGSGSTGGQAGSQMGNLAGLLSGISGAINETRSTTANAELLNEQRKGIAVDNFLKLKYGSGLKEAEIYNLLKSGEASSSSAKKYEQETARIKGGAGSALFGTEPSGGNIATTALSLIGMTGLGKTIKGASSAAKVFSTGKGFSKFLGSLK